MKRVRELGIEVNRRDYLTCEEPTSMHRRGWIVCFGQFG